MPHTDALDWLQDWFACQCNGDWEHSYGISLNTLDNPGWTFKIDLIDTSLKDRVFPGLFIDRSDTDWFHCIVTDGCYQCACGPRNLVEGILVFRAWVETLPEFEVLLGKSQVLPNYRPISAAESIPTPPKLRRKKRAGT